MKSFTYKPGSNTEVVTHLIIVNVLFFLVHNLFPIESRMLYGYSFLIEECKLWQVFSHMFMHANFSHIFFNMFSLYMFGRVLASLWGWQRFLFFYFTCGLVAFFAHQAFLYYEVSQHIPIAPFLGASGAVYGVLVGFAVLFPNTELMLLFPPIPMKAKYLIGGFVVLDLVLGISSQSTGVAHFAHIGGALAGFLLISYWKKNRKDFY